MKSATEDAIRDAAEKGGWQYREKHGEFAPFDNEPLRGTHERIFLDPAFWKALGKAYDWPEYTSRPAWKLHWHRFIDHLAEGGSIEDFFKSLV